MTIAEQLITALKPHDKARKLFDSIQYINGGPFGDEMAVYCVSTFNEGDEQTGCTDNVELRGAWWSGMNVISYLTESAKHDLEELILDELKGQEPEA